VKTDLGTLEFDVITDEKFDEFHKVVIPAHIVTSPIINYCRQHFNWNKDKVVPEFCKGELIFKMVK